MNARLLLPLLASLSLWTAAAQAATIISGTLGNGDFETPNVTSPTQVDDTGTAIPGWAFFGTDRDVGVYDSGGVGSQVLFIQGGSTIRSTATTSVIQVGDVLSFGFTNALNGRGTATMKIVYAATGTYNDPGATYAYFNAPGSTLTLAAVNSGTLSYTVTAADTAIIGKQVSVGFDNGITQYPEVDNVTFSQSPIPEPSMGLLSSFGYLVLLRRRRR